MKRRLICLFLGFCVLFSVAYAESTPTDAIAELIATEFPDGYVFNTTFDGGSGCFGFAKMIVNRLFGESAEGKIRSWNYAGESSTGMLVLDRLSLGEYTENNVRAMMQKARPGCIIQRNIDEDGASQHTMIFLSAGEDSFLIYDCNSNYDNVVRIRSINYTAWQTRTFLNVTLLIPDNYPDYTPEPLNFSASPKDDDEITARLNAVMATAFPLGTLYSSKSDEPVNRTFAKDVLKTVFGLEFNWGEDGISSDTMNLVTSIQYGNYGDFSLLRKSFALASPGDIIQLATGEFDRAHCMIFLSADEKGIWVFDADRQDDGIIRKRKLPYETRFHNGTWENISIFRAKNHPTPIAAFEVEKPGEEEIIEFSDVAITHWAYPHINALVSYGITRGRDETHFAPNDTVTRAEFVTFLSRMTDDKTLGPGSTTLLDNPDDAWYFTAVEWANSHGIARGNDKGYFSPNSQVTREDLAVMLVRFLKHCEVTIAESASVKFTDTDKIASYALDSVTALAKSGAISGKPDGAFSPKEPATRAECAKILHKAMILMGK